MSLAKAVLYMHNETGTACQNQNCNFSTLYATILFLFKKMAMPTLFYSIYVLKNNTHLMSGFFPIKNKYSNINMKDK